MITSEKLYPQYITDRDGHQTAVILPIDEYNSLLEDLADLAVAAERANEPNIPHEKVLKELREDGCLAD